MGSEKAHLRATSGTVNSGAEGLFADDLKALASRDGEAQIEAAERLLDSGAAAIPAVLTGLRGRSRQSRVMCSEILLRHAQAGHEFIRDDAVVAVLTAALADSAAEVVTFAALALGFGATERGIAALKAAADGKGAVPRAAAQAGLYAAGDEHAHEEALRLLAEGTVNARWTVALAMIAVGRTGRDVQALRPLLDDADRMVRETASNAIAAIEQATGSDPAGAR